MEYLYLSLLCICSYLVGNINFAILLSKKEDKDITKMGSGNPGTMNMLRNFGFKKALVTLLLDTLKGAVPALVGLLLFDKLGLYLAGLFCILGHNYPALRKFKGGKGMASTLGVFMVADPILTIICFFIGAIYLYFFDYGSVASFIVLIVVTIFEANANAGNLAVSILIFLIFLLVFFAHRKNITRLLIGTEGRVNFKRSLTKIFGKKSKKEIKKINKESKEREIG